MVNVDFVVFTSLFDLKTTVSQENGDKDDNTFNDGDKFSGVNLNENAEDGSQFNTSLSGDEGSAYTVSNTEESTSERLLSEEPSSKEASPEKSSNEESTDEATPYTESSKNLESEKPEVAEPNTASGPSMTETTVFPQLTQAITVSQSMVTEKGPYCIQLETMQKWRYDLISRIDRLRNFLVTGGRYPVFLLSTHIGLANELRFLDKMKRFLMSDRWLIYSDSIHANTLIRCETTFSYFGTRTIRPYWNMRLCCWGSLRFSCGSID